MKQFYKIFAIILGVAYSASAFAQVRTVTFTGRDRTDQYRIQVHHVTVFNLDQLWEEVLYYPDTTLVLGTVGIEDHELNSGLQLMQNVPNPFNGTTEFALAMQEAGEVQLEIYDITGKLAVAKRFSNLEAGTHLFRAALSSPQTYLLSAKANKNHFTIKMVNEGYAAGNSIQHLGMMNADGDFTLYLDGDKSSSDYPFNVGDEMKYTGYALIDGAMRESNTLIGQQTNSETIPLQFDVTVPTVAITSVDGITGTAASIGCDVIASGGSPVYARGVCWSTSPNPTVSDNHTTESGGMGSFTSNITGLSVGTTYYVRAYATNGVGTAYGSQRSFSTTSLPTVTTSTVTNITMSSAACGGDVISDGGSSVTARGVCWSTSQNPTISDSHTSDGGGTGVFTSNLTGLALNTTYYVRAYATNSAGTAYGDQGSLTTQSGCEISTLPYVENFDSHPGSTSSSMVTNNLPNCWSHYNAGTSTSYSGYPIIYNSSTYAASGTNAMRFYIYTTSAYADQIAILPPIDVNTYPMNTLQLSFDARQNNNSYVFILEVGVMTDPTNVSTFVPVQTVAVTSTIYSNFQVSLAQYTGTGSYIAIKAPQPASGYNNGYVDNVRVDEFVNTSDVQPCPNAFLVTDYDGNVYNTVQIGTQCWMKENLRTTHYADGTIIVLGSDISSVTPYRYCPQHFSSIVAAYGYLYNWKAVMRNSSSSAANPSGVQGICPDGWHVPSDAEWAQLTNYVSNHSQYVCGNDNENIAKALASSSGWLSNNNICTVGNNCTTNNSTGFSALPSGGYSCAAGYSDNVGFSAAFWSSSECYSGYPYSRHLHSSVTVVSPSYADKNNGFSVRCVCD